MYLKYYFGYDGKQLSFDSIACREGETPMEPSDFLKWYEIGDFAPHVFSEKEREAIAKSESPLHAAAFLPRKVTFSVDELLRKRCIFTD